jgi:hypothetical protein
VKLRGSGEYQFVYSRAWQRREYPAIIPFILELLRRFDVALMVMDPGGGGNIVRDLLCDPNTVKSRDDFVWDKEDDRAHYKTYGRKILHMQPFTNQWVDEAIHGMRADIEHKRFTFPRPNIVPSEDILMSQYARYVDQSIESIFTKKANGDWTKPAQALIDSLTSEILGFENKDGDRIEDGVIDHINETICEICAIEQQGIPNSASLRYDLPKLSAPGITDVRHRDRYTATLMASFGARILASQSAHKPPNLASRGTTPQRAKSSGRQSNVRKGRRGGAMTFDYSDYYKKQQDGK